MKIEYDAALDLLYLWLGPVGSRAARTVTVSPGVHADFDAKDRLVGLEVLDATEVLGPNAHFEVSLSSFARPKRALKDQ